MEDTKKEFETIKELKEVYYTIPNLFEYLRENGFPASYPTFKKWEKKGYLPKIKRIFHRGKMWRVFSKDGVDFANIKKILEKRTHKHIF